jgi:hypothetical protein
VTADFEDAIPRDGSGGRACYPGLAKGARAVKRAAVALAEAPSCGVGELDGLRRRLAGAGTASQGAVLLDFLEDELREARGALGAIDGYVASVGAALADPKAGRRQLLALASTGRPAQEVAYLEATLGRLRRRLAQLSGRLPGGT